MKDLIIFDTKERKKVPFKPENPEHVKMYTCGPTVYNFAHIGNLRTYIFEDLLRRTMEFLGMNVIQIMNLTDVDDKTIKGAIDHGLGLKEFTKKYEEAFFQDLQTLGIQKAKHYPAATDHIQEMIEIIQELMDKGYAYQGADGSIFYRIQHFKKYGALSHFCLEDLKVGASERVGEQDEYEKESAADFVLWKKYNPTRDKDVHWDSPWGQGRPGWHIECSAMAMKHLGHTLDMHCGGIDNAFPHHENEIAQSEACTGKIFSRHWMHSAHLIVDGKKMSKSLGNFYTLRDLLQKGFSGRVIRWLLLQTHYRIELNFSFRSLEAAEQSLKRIDDFIYRLEQAKIAAPHVDVESKIPLFATEMLDKFTSSMLDDLNIAEALAPFFDFIRFINGKIDAQHLSLGDIETILEVLRSVDKILGVIFCAKEEVIPEDVLFAVEKRTLARQLKDFKLADEMRALVREKGYEIEDTPSGPKIHKL
ncbi:MAG: cysteine--tRNA ligase [Chlamydiae bacterium]|nr:cysteine--tRNA ligase [Chlamydiota bacterium]